MLSISKLKQGFLLSIMAVSFFSCTKKEGCTDPLASNYDPEAEVDCCCEYETGFSLELSLESYVGANVLEEGDTYNLFGMQTRLDLVQFYISNVRLVDVDGVETPAEAYLLVKPETQTYALGTLPEGSFTALRFDVGIDSLTNHADPTQYDAGDPLGPQFPNMHWGWDFGYIFVRVDGLADQDLDGTPETSFEMHLGDDPLLRTVELGYVFSATEGDSKTISLQVDWLDFFDSIDMTGTITTHTTDNFSLATTLADNLAGMFSVAE